MSSTLKPEHICVIQKTALIVPKIVLQPLKKTQHNNCNNCFWLFCRCCCFFF